jgi:hypothetical protein
MDVRENRNRKKYVRRSDGKRKNERGMDGS